MLIMRLNIKHIFIKYIYYFAVLLLVFAPSLRPAQSSNKGAVIREFHLSYEVHENPLTSSVMTCLAPRRPKIGLALSGGGIRGIAQVGVLKVLEEENIPVDMIVGSSIGGVVGALYASGYSPEEIIDIVRTTEWASILSDSPQRSALFLGEKEKKGRALLQFRLDPIKPVIPEAFSLGQTLHTIFFELILNATYHAMDFEHLRTPLRIIATDMLTGEKVVLDHGDLAKAMRATVGIPLLFTPVEYGNDTLVDGGVLDNIPVMETRNSGADIVIAVDTTSPLRAPKNISAPWEVADQITTIMQQQKDSAQLDSADVAISFDDLRIVSTNFDALNFLYQEGIERARLHIPTIQQKLQDLDEPPDEEVYLIDRVTVSGATASFLKTFVNTEQTEWSSSQITAALKAIFNHGDAKNVSAQIYQKQNEYILDFTIELNPHLKSVVFYGNSQFPSDSLMQHFENALSQPINRHKMQSALEQILKMYRRRGLSLAKVNKINYNEHDGSAHIYIFEGFVKEITVSGLQKTQPFVISREFEIREGELFRFKRAQDGLKNILATDLFSAANLSISSESIYHTVHLQFKEKPSHVVRIGARYDSERSAKIFSEFSDENIFGTGNDLAFHVQYGGRDFKTYLDYRADRIFKTLLTSRINLHRYESEQFAYVNLERTGEYIRHATGLNIEVGRQMERFGTLSGNLRFEKIDLFSMSGYGYDTGSTNINTFGMKSVIDTRDEMPFATTGKYHIFFYELSSGLVLGADASYYKVMNQLATYSTFWKRHTFCPRIIWGTSSGSTPYSEQFRFGGLESFYGLREGQIWGKHMILTSLDYRFWLPEFWPFKTFISARYDLGAMWAKMEEIRTDDFISGYGAAISFKTPVGPFNFAYGQTNRGQWQFYFSAGFEF